MRSMRRDACASIMAVLTALAVGCKSAPPPPKPVPPAKVLFVASADVNPDRDGRPSPIFVRLYLLKEEGAFNNASYFALLDKEQETLGPSLLSREEYPLRPGQTLEFEMKIPPEARFLAVAAQYYWKDKAKWKAVAPAPDMVGKHTLTMNVAKSQMTIMVK
jgi:type VI secretion system protein VasD